MIVLVTVTIITTTSMLPDVRRYCFPLARWFILWIVVY